MKRLVALTAVATCGLGLAHAVAGPAPTEPEVRTFSSGDKSELVKTIPVTRKRGAKSKVVMRVDAGKLGPVEAGDRFLSSAEVEVTTCLDAPSGPDTCVGKPYPYDPHVGAKVVLSRNPGSARGEVIGDARELECSQHHPHRNHHCVLSLPWQKWVADEQCNGCHVNLVMTAWKSEQARDGHQVVIGAHGSSGPIEQDRGRLSLVRFRDGVRPDDVQPKKGNKRAVRVPIANEGGGTKFTFVRSVQLHDLDAGDEIYVDSNSRTAIGGVPYNVLIQSKMFLARGRNKLDHAGTSAYSSPDGQMAELNGFNCTQGGSAHRTPCVAPKRGVARITQDINSLYVILLVSAKAMMNESNDHTWRSSHRAKVKGSSLKVYVHR
jgi:hypothetical protein